MLNRILYMIFFLLVFMAPCICLSAESPPSSYVGVFCATDEAVPDLYKTVAFELGRSIARSNHGLITGAANTGLMNAAINGFVSEADPNHTKGILPSIFKSYEVHHLSIPEHNLIWTDTIHQRLQSFQDHCSVMVILPGGFGTLHELMDFMVPNQWGLTKKKIILLNVDHYWDNLLLLFENMIQKKALKQKHVDLLVVVDNVEDCMKAILSEEALHSHEGLKDRYWEK